MSGTGGSGGPTKKKPQAQSNFQEFRRRQQQNLAKIKAKHLQNSSNVQIPRDPFANSEDAKTMLKVGCKLTELCIYAK